MCIALLTTSHPGYALIAIDNRDEYILRPTSRPHWWTPVEEATPSSAPKPAEIQVLSSRDLQRAERGTWLGITKGGNFAVLTNYRETDTHDAAHPIHGKRSRGGMVTAWLGADPEESTSSFVRRMVEGGDVKGVGGFSLICGKLRKTKGQEVEPLAILSNRHDHMDHVPWVCGQRGGTYGLSNKTYTADETEEEMVWPKVQEGIELLKETVASAVEKKIGEEELIQELYKVLDVNRFPDNHNMDLEEGIPLLKHTILVPAFGGKAHQQEMEEARARGRKRAAEHGNAALELTTEVMPDDNPNGFSTGLYGTQRQTIVLVDWDGNVTYRERSLWDSFGNPIPRGSGDVNFQFKVDGWESRLEPQTHL